MLLRNVPVPEQYLLAAAVAIGLHRWRPWPLPCPRFARRGWGWMLVAVAVALISWSLHATRTVNLEHPAQVVSSGPYAHSRNPMYVAWALLSLGAGLVANSAWMLAAVPVAFWRVHREVLREERMLVQQFPASYRHYAAAVPRYLRLRSQRG